MVNIVKCFQIDVPIENSAKLTGHWFDLGPELHKSVYYLGIGCITFHARILRLVILNDEGVRNETPININSRKIIEGRLFNFGFDTVDLTDLEWIRDGMNLVHGASLHHTFHVQGYLTDNYCLCRLTTYEEWWGRGSAKGLTHGRDFFGIDSNKSNEPLEPETSSSSVYGLMARGETRAIDFNTITTEVCYAIIRIHVGEELVNVRMLLICISAGHLTSNVVFNLSHSVLIGELCLSRAFPVLQEGALG
jgi:hypothetical protein